MTTNGRGTTGRGAKPQDPLGSFKNLGEDVWEGYQEEIDQALEESLAIQEAEAKFGSPGAADIYVRREGWLQRENPDDRRRANALKANRDRKVLSAHHLNDLGGLAVTGEKFVLDVAEHLSDVTDNLPNHLQPLGKALTKASVQILSGALIESLKHNAERGSQEIDQATKPKQQQ